MTVKRTLKTLYITFALLVLVCGYQLTKTQHLRTEKVDKMGQKTNLPTSWQPFTDKFISTDNTISFVEIVKNKFQFKQINTKGETVDSFTIEK